MKHLLLIERDPFVRTDMEQALRAEFPACDLHCQPTFEKVGQIAMPQLILADVTTSELNDQLAQRTWHMGDVFCILTASRGQENPGRFLMLSRPFTDDILLSTVHRALKSICVGC